LTYSEAKPKDFGNKNIFLTASKHSLITGSSFTEKMWSIRVLTTY